MTRDQYIAHVLDRLPRATPSRAQIALELAAHIDARLEAGDTTANVVKQLGDPEALANSYLAAVPLADAICAEAPVRGRSGEHLRPRRGSPDTSRNARSAAPISAAGAA